MLRGLATRSMDVSDKFLTFLQAPSLLTLVDGYGHLILRVEFAKRAT